MNQKVTQNLLFRYAVITVADGQPIKRSLQLYKLAVSFGFVFKGHPLCSRQRKNKTNEGSGREILKDIPQQPRWNDIDG